MRFYSLMFALFLLVGFASSTHATIIHVPADSATIQAGINGAVDGDTVLVADGTYTGDGNRDIDFLGKAIVVMSENGAENCVIDCEGGGHRGFRFHSGEDATSVLEGFTIQHGSAGWIFGLDGAGIYCSSSSPNIRGNTISECGALGGGGGIYCINSSAVIIGNTITGNGAGGTWERPGGYGGGIYCGENSSPIITGNTITGNVASCVNEYCCGGGICCSGHSSPIIIGNTITGNSVIGYETSADGDGTADGGGICCRDYSSPIIIGNTITGNTASTNYGDASGGGIYYGGSSSSIVMNSIVWGNSPDQIYGKHTVTYSNIQGGYPGEGNIDADPMFVQPDTSMYTDYRLLWGSPCIDTGHPDSLDADGTRSDMGAHYFNQDDYLTLYLTPDMTEVVPGGQLGVTYTLINRWSQPEPFCGLTQVILPGGDPFNLIGPDPFTLPANRTIQQHFNHNVPASAPLGQYEYWTQIGSSPSTLYDEDRFTFAVNE